MSGGALIGVIYLLNRAALGLFLPAARRGDSTRGALNAIVLWSFAFFGMSMVLYGVVRATGAVMPPLIMLAIALWGIRVPFAYRMLVDRWQADAIWWSFPLASMVSMSMASRLLPLRQTGARCGSGIAAPRRCRAREPRAPNPAAPARVPLVVRCGAFGDMVLLTALIRALHARFGWPVDIVTSGPWSEPLLAGQPGVGEILSVRSRKTPYWLAPDQQRVVRRLRLRGAGPTWFCDASDAARPMLERAGIPQEYIVDVKDHPLGCPASTPPSNGAGSRGLMPPAAPAVPPPRAGGHGRSGCVSARHPSAAGGARSVAARRAVFATHRSFSSRRATSAPCDADLRRLAVNHKYWPNERWAAVISIFCTRIVPRHRIVLLGTGPEYG